MKAEQRINPDDWKHLIEEQYECWLPDGTAIKVERIDRDGMASARRLDGELAGRTVLVMVTSILTVRPEID